MKRQTITTFQQAAAYIDEIPRFTSKHTVEETKAFLHLLGDPDQGMRIIHVAGTNGKGSVCACMESILKAAGYRVALFTSPHLVSIRERFVVEGEMVSEEDFLRAFLHVYNMLDWDALEKEEGAYHPTYFEYLFFMAMVLFAEKKPDFCILETGVGGRLDATNSVSRKEITVITHISLDHVEYLGHTVDKIAFEKAGILRKGVPAVYWDTCPESSAVIREQAEKLGVLADSVSEKDYSFLKFNGKTIDFCVHTRYDGNSAFHRSSAFHGDIPLTLDTIAAYQMENCTLAVRAIEVLGGGKLATDAQIREGVRRFFWAGRMEEVLPEVYVDGAHNEDGIRAFLESVAADGHQGERVLLFSAMKDKDYGHMAEELAGSHLFRRLAIVHMQSARALDRESMAVVFGKWAGCGAEGYDSAEEALLGLLGERHPGERIYIAGSLYLVGEIKELLNHDKFRRRIEKISSQP